MPGTDGLLVSSSSVERGLQQRQLGFLSYPKGEFRTLTTDTNDYFHPSVSADGKTIAAEQIQSIFAAERGARRKARQPAAVPLMSHEPIYHWNWMPDGKLIVPQGGAIRLSNPAGGESVLLSDDKRIPLQGRVLREVRRVSAIPTTGGASVNLWRMDTTAHHAIDVRAKRAVSAMLARR